MKDQDKTKAHLISELEELRGRVETLEAAATEGKRAAVELRYEHRVAQQYLDVAGVIMVVLDKDGNIRFLNRKGYAVLGYDDGELIGKNWFDACVPQRIRDEVKSVFGELIAGKVASAEYYDNPVITKSGEERIIAWHNAVLTDDSGAIVGTLSSALDITDRKRIEEAHRQSEQRLSLHFQQTPLAAIEWDVEGRVTKWNPSAERIFGYSQEEALGCHVSFIVPPHVREHVDHVSDDLRGSKGGYRSTNENVTKDGRTILCEWYNTPLIDTEGQVIGVASLAQDISEQKRAEEAVRASEAKYRRLHESMRDAFVSVSMNGRIQEYNQAYRAMLGYEPEELLTLRYTDITPQAWHAFEAEIIENQILPRGYSDTYEKEYRRKDGTVFPVELRTFLIRDDEDRPVAMWAIVRDITDRKRVEEALKKARNELEERVKERTAELSREVEERKQAEDALAESEKKYRQLVETTGTGYLILDGHGRVIDANAEYIRITGHHTLEEILGRTVVEWTAPYDVERNAKEVEKCYRIGFTRQLEIDYVHPDGKIVPIDINATCLDTENGRQIVCLCRDITERRQAQEALQNSEERYDLAVRGAGVGIWDYDVRTGKVYYSPRWKTLFGYDEDEIGDSVEDWARLLHPKERDWILNFQDDFLAGTSTTTTVEYRLRHKDGSYRWIVANAIVVRDEQGTACRLVGSHGDITDRKLAEEALERERQSLWRMLQASDHERQIISYEIHDGLAQYLTGAIMQFEISNRLREENPSEAVKTYDAGMLMVRESLAEARRLISAVRPPIIDENGIEMAISHLVHEQRRPGAPKIECSSNVQFKRLPSILENALYRIAQEALTNACKHSQSKKVTVTMTQEGQDVRLKVQDWGIGFDPEAVGTGHFGLEGIRQRVRLLGGRLTIESRLGSGTLVQVVVPVVERQSEE